MKAFLLYPQQDFDLQRPLPPHHQALTQDLALNTLFQAMARGDTLILEVVQKVLLGSTTDLDTIQYRQQILQDCLQNTAVVRELYQIPIEAQKNKQRGWMGIYSSYPSGILSSALEMLQMFMQLLQKLKQLSDTHAARFTSVGFKRFFAMIQAELNDDYFATVQDHLKALQFRDGVLISAALGPGNEGRDYVLRKPHTNEQSWLERLLSPKEPIYSFRIHPRDDHGARAVSDLKNQGINLVANAVAQSADHIDNFFKMLRVELAFFMGCLNLAETLAQMDAPYIFPTPVAAAERRHFYRGLYDVCLALTIQQCIVGNNGAADDKEMVMITGANQGGKSTFLRSIGVAQLMMQAGMFVPAVEFSANVCTAVFTHFRREEDASMTSGKLDEELARMSDIIDAITPHALLLFNESFATTNEREGSEIGRQIVRALLQKRIKIFFVTHLYELAHGFYAQQLPNVLFLRAERQADGERTFRIIPGAPLKTSYGIDLYRNLFGQPIIDLPKLHTL